MKRALKILICKIALLINLLFSPKLLKYLGMRFNQFYSLWISNEFKKIESNFFIKYPIYLYGGNYISIGNSFSCDQRFRLEAIDQFCGDIFEPHIIIGDNVSLQKDCHIAAINKIIIGNNVLLASKVYISDHSHGQINIESLKLPPDKRKLYSKGPVIIQDNVWIGEGVVILPGVTIGENSIIGANAVVTKSIPRNTVVAGNPARIIKEIID